MTGSLITVAPPAARAKDGRDIVLQHWFGEWEPLCGGYYSPLMGHHLSGTIEIPNLPALMIHEPGSL